MDSRNTVLFHHPQIKMRKLITRLKKARDSLYLVILMPHFVCLQSLGCCIVTSPNSSFNISNDRMHLFCDLYNILCKMITYLSQFSKLYSHSNANLIQRHNLAYHSLRNEYKSSKLLMTATRSKANNPVTSSDYIRTS